MKSWLFQGNPQLYRVRPALSHFKNANRPTAWLVTRLKKKIKAGDEVFFWQSGRGPKAALVGWGTTESDPKKMDLDPEDLPFVRVRAQFEGLKLRVPIKVNGLCWRTRDELLRDKAFSQWKAFRVLRGTNFSVPPEIVPKLRRFCV